MQHFIARRFFTMVPVVALVSLIAFGLLYLLPGDPALAILGEQGARDERQYQALRAELGLDRPFVIQYLSWAARAATGDFGTSIRTRQPIGEVIRERLATTVQLAVLSFAIGLGIALPTGIASARRPRSATDVVGTIFALSGVAIPHFWLGILLIYLFAVWLRWLPPSGYVAPTESPVEWLRLMLMPAFTLGTGLAAVMMRQIRSALVEVLQQEYVTVARAKGLDDTTVVRVHALRNALIPVITVVGLQIGRLLGGTVVVETIFSVPGMGKLAVDSIFFRDFPVVQSVVLVLAVAVLAANLIADILYAYVDPRIRYA